VERLRLAAPALGIDPDCRYPQSSFRLEHQDTIILHTDGVTDVRNPSGGFFGLPRLQRAVEISQPHADIITRNIETQLDAFAQGRALPDDVTVVALCAEPQREPVESEARVSEPLPSTPMPQEPGAGQLMTRIQSDRRFVVISGPGTWREAQRLLDLSNHAKGAGLQGVVLDLSQCTHLDSTFLGVLHDIVRSFSETDACIFEIQNIPRPVLNEITQLGLTDVLAHFRIEAVPLPESMRAAPETMLRSADMGRLLLRAHEALVEADPRNADRFAAVLDVLRQQARLSETAVEETEE
jgi:anti-anti-sigma regulatory factor